MRNIGKNNGVTSQNIESHDSSQGLVFEPQIPSRQVMETHHWFCKFPDPARAKKGLPLINADTAEQYCCPRSYGSFIAFRTHAFKSHPKECSGGLLFRHVIRRPDEGQAARNAVPVMRDAPVQVQVQDAVSGSGLEPDPESEAAEAAWNRQIQIELARMEELRAADPGSPQDSNDESSESESDSDRYHDAYENGGRRRSRAPTKSMVTRT